MQGSHNRVADDIREGMSQMSTELGLVLKHIIGVAEKVTAVKYFAIPQTPIDEYYYEEDSYVVNE